MMSTASTGPARVASGARGKSAPSNSMPSLVIVLIRSTNMLRPRLGEISRLAVAAPYPQGDLVPL